MKLIAWYVVSLVLLVTVGVFWPRGSGAQQSPIQFASAPCPSTATLTTGTEGQLVASPGISIPASRIARVFGEAVITLPTTTTGLTLRIRRGVGTAGAQVITPTTVSPTAGGAQAYTFMVEDQPGEVAGQQYSLTAQAVGAASTSTVNSCELWVVGQ